MTNGADPIAGASLQKNIGTSASLDNLANGADRIAGASQNDIVQTRASLIVSIVLLKPLLTGLELPVLIP